MRKGLEVFSLKGKTALVTGATGYLGREISFILAEAGATVFVNARSQRQCELLVEEMRAQGLLAECASFDVTSECAVKKFTSELSQLAVDILVNNAYAGGAGSVELANPEDYLKSFDVAVISSHRLVKGLLANLRTAVKKHGDASIINIASMYSLVSPDLSIYETPSHANPPFYGAAKAALLNWTRYSACEFGKEGIRVNAISPGPFPSKVVQQTQPLFVSSLAKKVPLRRVGTSSEIRGAVLYLASSASSYVTGSNLVIDGGWTCW